MFKQFFKSVFNKQPDLSKEEIKELELKIISLEKEILLREQQVTKLTILANKQDQYQERYLERILIHNKIITEKKFELEKAQLKIIGG